MKRMRWILPIALAAVLLGAISFYTRPMTLSQLCPAMDVTESEAVSGYYSAAPGAEDEYFEITEEDARFGQILALFENRKFRRSPVSLLPQGAKVHSPQEGDFQWEILFHISDAKLPDGSTVSGTPLRIHNFYGTLEVCFNGEVWQCTTADKDQWLKDVMQRISSVG